MPTLADLIAAAAAEGAGAPQFAALEQALRADPAAGRDALDSHADTGGAVFSDHPSEAHAAWLSMIAAMLATGSATGIEAALRIGEINLWPDKVDASLLDILLAQGFQQKLQELVNGSLSRTIDSYYEGIERGRTDPWGNFEPPEITAGIVRSIIAQLPAPLRESARSAVRSRSGEIANLIDGSG